MWHNVTIYKCIHTKLFYENQKSWRERDFISQGYMHINLHCQKESWKVNKACQSSSHLKLHNGEKWHVLSWNHVRIKVFHLWDFTPEYTWIDCHTYAQSLVKILQQAVLLFTKPAEANKPRQFQLGRSTDSNWIEDIINCVHFLLTHLMQKTQICYPYWFYIYHNKLITWVNHQLLLILCW